MFLSIEMKNRFTSLGIFQETNMDTVFHLLLLLPVTLCSPNTYCGECECFPKLSYPPVYMICQGLHVSTFPDLSFEVAQHINQLHLYSTLIVDLPFPDPEKFMRLERVIEQSNSVLECDTVKAWKEMMTYCTFDSECLNRTETTTDITSPASTSEVIPHEGIPSNTMSNILLAIAVISLAVVSLALAPCRPRGRGRRRRGARFPQAPCQCSDDPGDQRSPVPSAPPCGGNTGFEMEEFSTTSNENLYELE